jgi:carbonic anhydrase/acetyltransferase-like protein (isoleucine patch superfamily)
MRAYIVQSNRTIQPFGDPVGDMPVGGTSLSQWQEQLLLKFKLEPCRVQSESEIPQDSDRLVLYDDVFFTRRGLKSFLARWRKSKKKPARFALPEGSCFLKNFSDLQQKTSVDGQRLFNIWLLPKNSTQQDAQGLEIIFREEVELLPLPAAITGMSHWKHPITSSVCLHVSHWLHVLQINLLSIQVTWVDQVIAHPLWSLIVFLRSGLGRPRGFRSRVAKYANRIGRNVKIHPTAVVEGCIIGDNVQIGPQALVRGSIISEGCVLQERVNVAFSVVGQNSFVSKHSVVHACASFEQADMCMRGMQLCLVGRKAALTTRATPIDIAPGKPIRVDVDGEHVPIGMPMLGSCFGHEVFVGADVYVGPGRAIPNGVRVISDTSKILARIPKDTQAGVTYVVRDSSLVPVTSDSKS